MQKLIERLNQFNYSKTGIVTGLILGTIMTVMGIAFVINGIERKDDHFAVLISIIPAIGISSLIVEVYRLRKVLAKK